MVPSIQYRCHVTAQPHHNRHLCEYIKLDLRIYIHRVLCHTIREAASFNISFSYQHLTVICG